MPDAGYTYDATLDDLRLDVLSTSVEHGRAVHAHQFPKRDGAELEDSGREPWSCALEVIFFDVGEPTPGTRGYLDRFDHLDLLVGDGEIHTLVHPYAGVFRGRISEFSHDADGEGQPAIRARFRFTEDIALPAVNIAAAGVQARAGAQDVRSDAALAQSALDEQVEVLDPDVYDDATETFEEAAATAEEWEFDPEMTGRQVGLQLATLNNRLNRVLDEAECRTDLARHPIMKQVTLLQYSLRRAAAAFTSSSARIMTLTVREPIPLRVVAARFYGAAQAERRYAELRDLNPELSRYSLVPAQSKLRAYAPDAPPRRYAP